MGPPHLRGPSQSGRHIPAFHQACSSQRDNHGIARLTKFTKLAIFGYGVTLNVRSILMDWCAHSQGDELEQHIFR